MPDRHLPIRGACGARPGGVPLRAWFDGILDLPAGDIESVREAVARINRVGYTKLDWDLEGGRVSLLADDTPIPPARMKESIRSDFLRAMEGLMEVLPPEGARESTLRCVEVYQEEVRETLFVPEGRTIQTVSRLRPTVERDRVGSEEGQTISSVASYGRGRLTLLGFLFLVLGALLVWGGGYLDRILSPQPTQLQLVTGDFGNLLAIRVEGSWGTYRFSIVRGADYPSSAKDIEQKLAAARTPLQQAILRAVSNGTTAYVRLETSGGKVQQAVRIELAALLKSSNESIKGDLGARMDSAILRLALDAGH